MPELPDVEVYVEALRRRLVQQPLESLVLGSPFLLRSVEVPVSELIGNTVQGVERLGKRIVFALSGNYYMVLHLMIAGRLHWQGAGDKGRGGRPQAMWRFPNGVLSLTEFSKKKRASLFLLHGKEAVQAHNRGGLEVLTCKPKAFAEALQRENHTLKRTLTDPRLFSGIGNAYSDEILHRACLSPLRLSQKLTDGEVKALYKATRDVLSEWVERLRKEAGDGFPEKVTAFRPEMAVHGKFRQPCPRCGAPVQRIVYAENETNYCPVCQNEGRLLADRSLSRLLKKDWPRTMEEMDELPGRALRTPHKENS